VSIDFSAFDKVAICIIIVCLQSAFLVGGPTHATIEAVHATINITKIVDKATQRPIKSNVVTLRWETPEGKVTKTDTYRNQSQFSTTMPADGSVRLFVIVEAPGYVKWENAIRMKFNSTKPVSCPVEMERMKNMQG